MSSLNLLKEYGLLHLPWVGEKLLFFPKECIALNISCARDVITSDNLHQTWC